MVSARKLTLFVALAVTAGVSTAGCKRSAPASRPAPPREPATSKPTSTASVAKKAAPAPVKPVASAGVKLDPEEIIRRSRKSVFLIAYRVPVVSPDVIKKMKDRRGKVPRVVNLRPRSVPRKMGPWILLCTAFAVGQRTLATSGSCAYFVRMAVQKRVDYFIAQNHGLARSFRVLKTHIHPAYCHQKKTLKHDLGIVEVDRDLGPALTLASAEELEAIREQDAVYYYGFPMVATPDLKKPTASMIGGKVVRLTSTEFFEKAPWPVRVMLHHDALAEEGSSGSPIFNAAGKVIGVQAGAHHYPLDLEAVPKTSKQNKRYSFGVRIDELDKIKKRETL